MTTRNRNAYLIQQGACNPIGIAGNLCASVRECIDEGGDPSTDVAISMIVHQLASLHAVSGRHGDDETIDTESFRIITNAYYECLVSCVNSDDYSGTEMQQRREGARVLIKVLYFKTKAWLYDLSLSLYENDYAIIKEAHDQS